MCSVPLGCGLVPGISAEGFMELSGSALIKRVALFRLGVGLQQCLNNRTVFAESLEQKSRVLSAVGLGGSSATR